MQWIKSTGHKVNHNIANLDLMQNKYLKIGQKDKRYKTVYLMSLMREITTIPWSIVNQIKNDGENKK